MIDNRKEDIYLFHNGKNYETYKLMCPYQTIVDNVSGWVFRTFAPNAVSISVVGNFNEWDRSANPMERISEGGIWEVFIPKLKRFDIYKFSIENKNGDIILKADPYATHTETPPHNASKLYDINGFKWSDEKWIEARKTKNPYIAPMNIYEVHLGSWKMNEDGNPYSYKQIEDELIPYVKKMNYTHIEIMPVTEFPFDGSWGYQVTGMFAPTSRYGTPADFMHFVNACHNNGIGIIMDWVAAHFPKDEYGLYKFDGTYLYEYADDYKRDHKEWGTVVYDFNKSEVRSFLISSAMFWINEYHIDGIRADAVASMLYLDYNRRDGEWRPNSKGNNYNLEAIDFIKELNTVVLTKNPDALMIAEESTSFPMITKPPFDGGLGFNFKWNMGWMNDTLQYASQDPYFRQYMHDKLTFSVTYAYAENYILPLSHDEVVHGKCSLISKMPGYYDDKFRALKTLMGYQISFPGKKLNFMGYEFAQFIEWNYEKPLDWFLLDYETHKNHQLYIQDLNEFYLNNKEFYELDTSIEGFKWVIVDDNQQNIIAYKRIDKEGNYTLCVMNFSPVRRENYKIGVEDNGLYKVVFSSNDVKYGGTDKKLKYKSMSGNYHNEKNYIEINIPQDSVQFIKHFKTRRSNK